MARFVKLFLLSAWVVQAPVAAQPVAPTSVPSVPAQGQRPPSDFAMLPFMVGPVLSPDGTKVAARLSAGGKQVLGIVDLFKPGSTPVIVAPGESELLDWRWVNDAWLAIRIGAVVDFQASKIYVTRVAGVGTTGVVRPIAFKEGGQSARVIWTAKDGTPRILISRQKSIYLGEDFWPRVSEVDVSTGQLRPVVGGMANVFNWYADPSGIVRMGVGYSDVSRMARLLYRDADKQSFRVVDRADQRREERLTVPILGVAGQTAMTVSVQNNVAALYELDLTKLDVGKRIWGIDGYDIDEVLTDPQTGALRGIAYTSDRARVHWVQPDLVDLQVLLDKAVSPRSATIVSMTPNRQRVLVHVGDGSRPGAYYYYDVAKGGGMQRIAFVNPAIRTATLGPVSTFRYKARDGQSIEAVLTLPNGANPAKLPLILLPHGGPEARDSETYDWWVQFLADRGYAVVQPNYRGSSGYGDALRKAGDGQWGLAMQDDLNDAVDHLAAKGTIDPKRVCIMGASYGGYAAMRGAQRDGTRFRCAISYAGVSDLNGMMSYDSGFLNSNAMRASWRSSAPDLKAVSPINFASEFASPILIMHGKKDLRVPVSQSRRMADRLKAAGAAVTYVEQPEGDHHFSREADRLDFLQRIEAFLKQHNPA